MVNYSDAEKDCVYQVIWELEYHQFESDFHSNVMIQPDYVDNSNFIKYLKSKTKAWNKVIEKKYGIKYVYKQDISAYLQIKNEKKYNLTKLKYSEKIAKFYENLYGY